jgi:hypothetical protein
MRSVMAYQFTIDVSIEDAPDGQLDSGDWHVILRVGRDSIRTVLHFSPATRGFTVPRPLGVQLSAGDSLSLSVSLADDESRTISVRMSIDFEAPNHPAERVAIQPAKAEVRQSGDSLTTTWEWIPEIDGRIMAVGGVAFAGAADVRLTDVEAGAILWSTGAHLETEAGSAAAGGVLRLAVSVVAGRTYRLSVTFHRQQLATTPDAGAMVMVRPSNVSSASR